MHGPGPLPDVEAVVAAYAAGYFPMDDPAAQTEPLPFWSADPRTVFELDPEFLDGLRRKLRRSLRADPGWRPATDRAFGEVVAACAIPPPGDAVWITPRLRELYQRMHAAGWAHSWELWDGDDLVFGLLGVRLGSAAMLESMFHRRSHAGNVGLVRALEALAADGVVLCDLQLPTAHTLRLGAHLLSARAYTSSLKAIIDGPSSDRRAT